MEKDYLDVLSKNVLNDVKNMVRRNYIVLEKEQEKKTDKKMLDIIKSVLEGNDELLYKKEEEKEDSKLNDYVIRSLIQYYVAIYNDNLDLLHKLLDNGFTWYGISKYDMNLFALDKRISSNFSEEKYLDILESNVDLLSNFYSSLHIKKQKDKINEDELINKVCNILKKDKNVSKTKRKDLIFLFTVDFLNYFSEEEILNLNNEQKSILENYSSGGYINLALKLIKDYNYSKELIYWDDFEKYFTIEEILDLSDKDIGMYDCIFGYHLDVGDHNIIISTAIKKIKEIKKVNSDFNCRLNVLVYSLLTKEQIMSLSEEAIDEINNRCAGYAFFKDKYDLSKNYLKRGIKIVKFKDGIKNKVKIKK